jgi:hypothetical protein
LEIVIYRESHLVIEEWHNILIKIHAGFGFHGSFPVGPFVGGFGSEHHEHLFNAGLTLFLFGIHEEVFAEVNRMHGTYEGWINYFYGGTNQILSLGYRPIFVIYSNGFSTMYFVSPRAWPLHQRLLKEKGFEAENSKALASITESPQR